MSDIVLRLYHHLPVPLRSVAASLRGLYLRSWRYGPETDRLVEEALERERWSPQRWKLWQEERLAYLLHRAATRVPYYRDQWAARRRRGERASWEYLENWPILEKQALRENPRAFVADDRDVRRMYYDHTAGTTGTPLDLWFSRETVRGWFALFEVRARRWNGLSRHDNWATLGGQAVVPTQGQRPPFWVWNGPLNQLYLSANHVSRRNAPAYTDALIGYGITHMLAYSSSASALARAAFDIGLRPAGPKLIITIGEPLFAWQRKIIRAGLGSEVRESYGMGEMVAAATECSAGTLHLWPEVGWLEVVDEIDDAPVSRDTSGRLVCTSLLNDDMPLVRYAVGDRGRVAKEDAGCPCGRTLPTFAAIEGRINDLLVTRDGRQIYWLNPIFYGLPVCEAQIIQETLDRVQIRCVPTRAFTSETERSIIDRLQARMGMVEVTIEQVDEVPRSANGKFRAVICNLPPELRELSPPAK
jgi:phenylacetate-coenzyme A ligase PaaK-like adenylate-forming protein